MRPVLLVLVLIALSPAPAGAQSGRIVGRVADATDAVLPGVAVTLFGGLDEPRVSVTDGAGRFVFAGLRQGAYRLSARLSGFETATVDGIVVATGPVEVPVITLPLAGLRHADRDRNANRGTVAGCADEHLGVQRHGHRMVRCLSMTIRGERRKGEVLVTVDGAPLDWRSSLAVRNHSPTGPPGATAGRAGPAQFALAVLLAVTDEATAEQFYQKFKWDVLAPLEVDRWVLDAGDILGWLESAAGTDDIVPLAMET